MRFGLTGVAAFAVVNHQTQPVSLSESFGGPNAADFSLGSGTCTNTLAALKSCSIIVDFKPGVLGTESATLTVSDSPDPAGPYVVALSTGETTPETVIPIKLSFGNVAQSATKTLSTLKVTNLSPYTLTLSEGLSGANAADFGFTPVASCAGNTVCVIPVSFTPSGETAESATLTVNVDQDPTSPHLIALAGAGITTIKALPASIAFGTIASGHSSVSKTVTVYNYGGATVALSESVSGINPNDFAVSGGTCGATLAGGGAHCTYTLKFTPGIVGPESATFGVSAGGDAGSPHNVSLGGTGS